MSRGPDRPGVAEYHWGVATRAGESAAAGVTLDSAGVRTFAAAATIGLHQYAMAGDLAGGTRAIVDHCPGDRGARCTPTSAVAAAAPLHISRVVALAAIAAIATIRGHIDPTAARVTALHRDGAAAEQNACLPAISADAAIAPRRRDQVPVGRTTYACASPVGYGEQTSGPGHYGATQPPQGCRAGRTADTAVTTRRSIELVGAGGASTVPARSS